MKNNNGVYLPDEIIKNNAVYFAIDNCDFNNNTPEGKDELRDTAKIVLRIQ